LRKIFQGALERIAQSTKCELHRRLAVQLAQLIDYFADRTSRILSFRSRNEWKLRCTDKRLGVKDSDKHNIMPTGL
jgi:hypothetical protein